MSSLETSASFAPKMLKGKKTRVLMLYIDLILRHVLESVAHQVEKYVEGDGKPYLSFVKKKGDTFFNERMIILLR